MALRAAALVDEGDRRATTARVSANACRSMAIDAEARLLGDLDELAIMSRCAATIRTFCLPAAFLAGDGGEDLVVQDGVVERDRDRFLRLELDRRLELLLVDEGELHGADDDLLVGHPQTEAAAGEPGLLPEALELGGQALDVDDFAFEHETFGQGPHGRSHERLPCFGAADLSPRDGGLLQIDSDAHTVLCHRRTLQRPQSPSTALSAGSRVGFRPTLRRGSPRAPAHGAAGLFHRGFPIVHKSSQTPRPFPCANAAPFSLGRLPARLHRPCWRSFASEQRGSASRAAGARASPSGTPERERRARRAAGGRRGGRSAQLGAATSSAPVTTSAPRKAAAAAAYGAGDGVADPGRRARRRLHDNGHRRQRVATPGHDEAAVDPAGVDDETR